MPTIAHPDTGERIDVEIIDEESHRSEEMVQVEAVDDDVSLTDESGEQPWLFRGNVEFGMVETPEDAVALADGRTPEEAEETRKAVEGDH